MFFILNCSSDLDRLHRHHLRLCTSDVQVLLRALVKFVVLVLTGCFFDNVDVTRRDIHGQSVPGCSESCSRSAPTPTKLNKHTNMFPGTVWIETTVIIRLIKKAAEAPASQSIAMVGEMGCLLRHGFASKVNAHLSPLFSNKPLLIQPTVAMYISVWWMNVSQMTLEKQTPAQSFLSKLVFRRTIS